MLADVVENLDISFAAGPLKFISKNEQDAFREKRSFKSKAILEHFTLFLTFVEFVPEDVKHVIDCHVSRPQRLLKTLDENVLPIHLVLIEVGVFGVTIELTQILRP